MLPKRWILLTLFLGAAFFSTWLFPAFSSGYSQAATNSTGTVLLGGISGRTLLRSGETLDVSIGGVPDAHDIKWILDGHTVGEAPDLHLQHLSDGEHTLSLTYRDAQDQAIAATTLVKVLEAEPYVILANAIQAGIYLPLWEEDYQTYIPLVQR